MRKKDSDIAELSDWTSNFDIPGHAFKHKGYNTVEKDPKRLTFFNTARYTSSLLHNKKNSRLELSPIVVKFNAKVLSQNLQKSK